MGKTNRSVKDSRPLYSLFCILSTLFLGLTAIQLPAEEVRIWTSAGGSSIEASLQGCDTKSSVGRSEAESKPGERWLKHSGYGLMFHYQVFKNLSPAAYNKIIDSFDVPQWADSIQSTGAGHVIFAIGQNWGKYCAPNRAYERLLGVENGAWTSKRDLIMEIGQALKKREIKLIVYATARAPMRHYHIIKALDDALPTMHGKIAPPSIPTMGKGKGFVRSEHQAPPSKFLKNWGDVYGEWSMRYKDLVAGWWIDGYKTAMKKAYEDLQQEAFNIDTWVAAIKSGNPNTELAFNAGAYPGAALCTDGRLCPHQTYTAGEGHGFIRDFKGISQILTPKNFQSPKGVIWHLLFPVSHGWGSGDAPKEHYTAEYLINGIDEVNAQGGAVTLDTPCAPDGTIPPAVLARLQELAKVKDKLKDGKMSFSGIKVGGAVHQPSPPKAVPQTPTAAKAKNLAKFKNTKTIGEWTPDTLPSGGGWMGFDVGTVIKQSGTFEFAFVYTKGHHGADIRSAALFQGDKKVSEDNHKAFSGGHLQDVVYSLNLPFYDANAKYTLKAEIKGNGGENTYGAVKFVGRE